MGSYSPYGRSTSSYQSEKVLLIKLNFFSLYIYVVVLWQIKIIEGCSLILMQCCELIDIQLLEKYKLFLCIFHVAVCHTPQLSVIAATYTATSQLIFPVPMTVKLFQKLTTSCCCIS